MSTQDEAPAKATALFDQFRDQGNARRPEEPVADAPGNVPDAATGSLAPETDGANGQMPAEARRALVLLLRHGVVMAESKRLAFEALCRFQDIIGVHLGNMYLHMLLDHRAGLAILLQKEVADQEGDEEEGSRLINKRTLSLYDSLLLLVLRKYYQEREVAGEQRIIIDSDRIETLLTPFIPLTNSSRSDKRTLSGALMTMKEKRLINQVRGDEDRFEISPVIRYVVNAEFLERLIAEYQRLALEATAGAGEGVHNA